MKKLLLVAALGVAGFTSAQKIRAHGCNAKGCSYTYASTCSTFTGFTTPKALTLEQALVIANDINQTDCETPVREVTISHD